MKNHFLFALVFLSICFSFCKNNNQKEKATKVDPFESAMPHTETDLNSELSHEDKKKLANAIGKSAIPISKNEMDSMIQYSNQILHVYSFFNTDSFESIKANQIVLSTQKEMGDSLFQVILFSLGQPNNVNKINSFIRENDVTSDVFYSSDTLNSAWFRKIHPNWSGEVPAIFMVNQSDGTHLFYQKKFSKEELSTLIQPFTL
ncbi:MAG: hypothetical protein AB8H03_10955 [Saprospiraceae bacterium]